MSSLTGTILAYDDNLPRAAASPAVPEGRRARHQGPRRVLERETSLGPRRFLVTVHSFAVLRAPGGKRDEAYAALVADLRVVAGALG